MFFLVFVVKMHNARILVTSGGLRGAQTGLKSEIPQNLGDPHTLQITQNLYYVMCRPTEVNSTPNLTANSQRKKHGI